MRSVLITGGTGSFGRAFAMHLRHTDVQRIAILSRGEHAQAAMRDELLVKRMRFFIGDVRDRERLRRAFNGIDVVIHAAALKRIEVGHYNPDEMVKTNILGAINVIEACRDAGVKKCVALSSDKAFQPISPYGQSKALAETLFRSQSGSFTSFAVTRYGNVWRSQGSVVPRWRDILRTANAVPVTDPDATRFFMRMDEAVTLVSNTIRDMKGGELVIPTLPAYRLGDLAEAMGAQMKVIGMPEYEKKHEGMCDGNTSDKARRMTVDELREILREDGHHHSGSNGQQAAAGQGIVPTQWSYRYRRGDFEVPKYSGWGVSGLSDDIVAIG